VEIGEQVSDVLGYVHVSNELSYRIYAMRKSVVSSVWRRDSNRYRVSCILTSCHASRLNKLKEQKTCAVSGYGDDPTMEFFLHQGQRRQS
jgi:hypothetical protein